MNTAGILLAAVVFVVAAASLLLLTTRRAQPAAISTALQQFAAESGGAFEKQVAGFGRVVSLQSGGWPLHFRWYATLAGPGANVASFGRLNAYGEYRSRRAFRLELTPRSAAQDGLTLGSRPPVVQTGLPAIDRAYVVRADDAALAAALLADPAVASALAAAVRPTSQVTVGPLTEGLLGRTVSGMGAVALNEEEEPLTVERLRALRALLTALLDALARQQLAAQP